MTKDQLDKLKTQLSVEAKNGVNFTIAATIIWAAIAFIWTLEFSSYNKAVMGLIAGSPLLPLAFMFSKIFHTKWKIEDNPLQPLGLWLNFAQFLYFPFLIFILIKQPDYFVMAYAIITGAHLFPYSWFYKTNLFAIFAGIISIGSLLLALYLDQANQFYIGIFTSACLLILSLGLMTDYKKKIQILEK